HLFKTLPVVLILLLVCFASASAIAGDEVTLPMPVIYGDFNSWAIEGDNARPLAETAAGSGIFKGSYNFDAYAGDGDGYAVFVCVTKVDYDPYGWGAGEQYTLAGEAAVMGSESWFKPTVTGLYEFTYDSATHITTILPPEVLFDAPVIYGDFNSWAIEGENARPLVETATGSGIFKGSFTFDAYTGDGDGYSVFTCISKINYGQYGWGAGLQYKLNGEVAGFGATSFFKPTVTGLYEFTYDSATHITTILPPEVLFDAPVIYGDFNGWAIEGENARPLVETGTGTGIFKAIYSFDAYTGDGDGYTAIVCLSKMNYGEWGWGAGTQYTVTGEAAVFGTTSIFKPTITGNYEVTYNSTTHITTFVLVQSESPETSDPGVLLYAFGLLGAAAVATRSRKSGRYADKKQ
ncbi:MAG: hypothetical protein ACYC5K_13675, partial [Saccharofermentanales bacterium]